MEAYLDHAASTPARPEVVETMLPWLTDHPGLVSLQWGGRQIETSTAFAATALLLLLVLAAGLYRFWRWLLSSPLALSNLRAEGRRRKGYQALSSGLVAVAAGGP